MPTIRLSGVREKLAALDIDPDTSDGWNDMINWFIDLVPTATGFGFAQDDPNVFEIFDPYIQPPRLLEVGEVLSIDYSSG